ncbi:MAG: transposase [Lentisphaerae bacterium]|nr:transposase [Lentisphaerota bacterium]
MLLPRRRFSGNTAGEDAGSTMEMISRRAFVFRNFENYRLRVRVMCA